MTDKRKASINEKIKVIEDIIKYFEQEEIDIDEAIEKYEKAVNIVGEMDELLKKYKTRLEKVDD